MSKVVVTGGAGFIGSHLARRLADIDYSVIVYDDLSNASGLKNLPKTVKIVKGDVLDYDKLKSVIKGADVVFHLACKALPMSFTKPKEVFKVNDEGTYVVCRACYSSGVNKLIYASSSEVYGTAKYVPMDEEHPLVPTTVYGASKASGEMYVQAFYHQYQLPSVIIRPFNSYGPYMRQDGYAAVIPRFVSRVVKGLSPIIFGDGNQTRDFTYVDDIVDGIALAASEKTLSGTAINLAISEEVSVNKIARLVIKTCNDILGRKLDLEPRHQKPREGDVRRHHADISKAREILNFKPRIHIDEGIVKFVTWYINNMRRSKFRQ